MSQEFHEEPDSSITHEEIERILTIPKHDFGYHPTLMLAKKYMNSCADCLSINPIRIFDEKNILPRFEEIYLVIKNIIIDFNEDLSSRVNEIESKLNLSQNIIKLSMLSKSKSENSFFDSLSEAILHFGRVNSGLKVELPDKGTVKISQDLLLELKTALTRLAGLMGAAAKSAQEWALQNEDVLIIEEYYDPRKVRKQILISLLKSAYEELEKDSEMPVEMKVTLKKELDFVFEDLGKKKTSWNKIFSRLTQIIMLLGALTAVTADIDDAFKNVKAAHNYAKKALNYVAEQALTIHQFDFLNPNESNKKLAEKSEIEQSELEDEDKNSSTSD